MFRIVARRLHTVYRGYQIYKRENAKRRPWSVYIREHDRYAAKTSLEDCKRMIDQMEEHNG